MHLQAARSRSSCTRMVPDIIKPRPNPGKMYALFAWPGTKTFPSYSTEGNGLPLAKMAHPYKKANGYEQ